MLPKDPVFMAFYKKYKILKIVLNPLNIRIFQFCAKFPLRTINNPLKAEIQADGRIGQK